VRPLGYGLLEPVLVVVLVLGFVGVQQPLLSGPWPEVGGLEIDAPENLRLVRLSYVPAYALLLGLAAFHVPAILDLAVASRAITLLTLLCPISILWSIAPEDTARRSFGLLMTWLLGMYLAARFSLEAWLRLLALGLSAAVAISLATGLLAPEIGIMKILHPGAWRGVFPHKNMLGHIAALDLMVLGVLAATISSVSWRALLLGTSLAVLALVLSQSITALVTICAVILAAIAISTARALPPRPGVGLCVVLSLVVAIGTFMVADYEQLLASVGRDSTLTGRTELWQEIFDLIERRPWLGYGYGAFWSPAGGEMMLLRRAIGWPVLSAHNGYLDVWLQLGALGLILLTLSLIGALATLARQLYEPNATVVVWVALMLTYLLVYNVVESVFLRQNDLTWAIYLATVAGLARERSPSERLE
jgi:exopolysaccharide production protein ExoQ